LKKNPGCPVFAVHCPVFAAEQLLGSNIFGGLMGKKMLSG
jgi:hypothetical protein